MIFFLYFAFFSLKGVIHVSNNGNDIEGCGSDAPEIPACKTLAFASKSVETYPKLFDLTPGIFIENDTIAVDGSVDVIGLSQEGTILSRPERSWFILFKLNFDLISHLTVQNLTFILGTHSSGYNTFRAEGGFVNDDTLTVGINLVAVRMVMNYSLESITGRVLYAHNSKAFVVLQNCQLFNITSQFPLFFGSIISDFYTYNTTFNNITTLGGPGSRDGGCIYLKDAFYFTLEGSLFASCSVGDNGGVLYVENITNPVTEEAAADPTPISSIVSSSFWNISAGTIDGGFGGALFIRSESTMYASLIVVDTSFVLCSTNGTYAAAINAENGLSLWLEHSSFVACRTNATAVMKPGQLNMLYGGAALRAVVWVDVTILRSVFVECAACSGGAIYVGNNTSIKLSDSVFAGNSVYMEDMGIDLYFDSTTLVTSTRVYTNNAVAVACGNSSEDMQGGGCPLLTLDYLTTPQACITAFLPNDPYDANPCPMPCASDRGVCGWPSQCSATTSNSSASSSYPIGDVCTPSCAFFSASPSSSPSALPCTSECVLNSALGTDLCAAVCEPKTLYETEIAATPGVACIPIHAVTPPGDNGSPKKKSKVNGGAAAAVVIILLVVVAIVVVVVVVFVCKRKSANRGYRNVGSELK